MFANYVSIKDLILFQLLETSGSAAAFEIFGGSGNMDRRGRRSVVFFNRFDSIFSPFDTFTGETDFSVFRVNAENFDFEFFANFDDFFRIVDFVIGKLRDMEETFQTIFQSDEDAEIGDLGNGSLNELTGFVFAGNIMSPRIFGHLFQTKSDAAASLINGENAAFDFLAFSTISLG